MPNASLNWWLEGDVISACSCDHDAPTNISLPTSGKCAGSWNWKIRSGHYGDVRLDGLAFSLAVNWPGPSDEGRGEAFVIIDERADAEQREALRILTSGIAGGPWRAVMTTEAKLHGPEFAPFEFNADSFTSRMRAGSYITLEMEPLRNKVTQAKMHMRAALPKGYIFEEADLGMSKAFRIDGPVSFDHTGQYAAVAPFRYQSSRPRL
jgi:hypothetical protein